MLYYFKCQKCGNTSGLYLESELPSTMPSCTVCKDNGGSTVVKRKTVAFFFGCGLCQGSWTYTSPTSYSQQKKTRPVCPTCKTNSKVFFVPPQATPPKVQKRRRPGIVDPNVHEVSGELELKPEVGLTGHKRRWSEVEDDFKAEEELFSVGSVQDPGARKRIKLELAYREQKQKRKDFDEKYGPLVDQHDPLKTSFHPHRVVRFTDYQQNHQTHTKSIGGTTYPRSGKQGPVFVNGSRVVDRSHTWDYRELGPNSFLRRLCSLLYVLDYGKQDSMNPVELQAMWASGSLYISCNNYSFTEKIYNGLVEKKTLMAFLGELQLGTSTTGKYPTTMRNFSGVHKLKLPEYQRDFVSNQETSYPDYFLYQWTYVFKQLREALECQQISKLTITKNDGDYRQWTVGSLSSGSVYIVFPEKGRGTFQKKKVHAEQLFYPILTRLNGLGLLSSTQPAFIGGVKTPCRTCSMVLQDAAALLGDKLVLPTDAFGHYWEYSGMHVTNPVFNPNDLSMVWGKDTTSDSLTNTECPPSPERK